MKAAELIGHPTADGDRKSDALIGLRSHVMPNDISYTNNGSMRQAFCALAPEIFFSQIAECNLDT